LSLGGRALYRDIRVEPPLSVASDLSHVIRAAAIFRLGGKEVDCTLGRVRRYTPSFEAFRGVTDVIIRCNKVADPSSLLLIACVDCIVILVSN
jgi:hypothetical protein